MCRFGINHNREKEGKIMMMFKKHKAFIQNQDGLVSFIVTMLLMVMVSLIILAFAKITNREQRQSLDRQLSTAAFYAAESGVADARLKLGAMPAYSSNNCADAAALSAVGPQLSSNVSYTCVLVNPEPKDLFFAEVSTSKSKVFPVNSSSPISQINFSWYDTGNRDTLSSCPNLENVNQIPANWSVNCEIGILRVDLVPTSSLKRDDLVNNAMTFFLYPRQGGPASIVNSNLAYGTSQQGFFVPGQCSGSPKVCTVGISSLASGSRFMVRVRAIYRPVSLKVTATDGVDYVGLAGAQAVVDSTGKAQDVVRRIQVRIPIRPDLAPAEFVVDSSGDLCKRFTVTPGASPVVVPDTPVSGIDACRTDN